MSSYVIKLPDVGEGIAEAEIVAWHVNVGDTIGEDDPIVEVMTDKATVELPSPVSGKIVRLGAEIGDLVPVGSDLIWIDLADHNADQSAAENPDDNGDASGGGATAALPEGVVALASESHLAADMQPDVASERPTARVVSAGGPPTPTAPRTTPSSATPSTGPAVSQPRPARSTKLGAATSKPLAAPAVRRRAQALDINLGEIVGSGPDGRVEHADLDTHLTSAVAVYRSVHGSTVVDAAAAADEVQAVKIVGLRRNIAQRMKIAKDRIPHFTYVDEIDMTELERLRAQLNDDRAAGLPKLTMLPFLMRAVIVAVVDFPQMNARFDDEAGVVQRYRAVHLGVAAQTPKGLMVPVLEHAESHDLWSSATEVARLAAGARDGTIKLAELSGSTITISSLGAVGGIVSTPIINYPEVAIIGVNKMVQRPVYVDGQWVPRQMMNLSSSFDHRVVDGFDAAQFIQRIRELLETPALLFMS